MLDLDDRLKKAFDFAKDATRQLISLSTGVLALTITFADAILGGVSTGPTVLLMLGWVGYLLSIVFGMVVLFAMTGSLEAAQPAKPKGQNSESEAGESLQFTATFPSLYDANITRPAKLQILLFLGATLLIVAFAVWGTIESMRA